jgi:hypothetical protein
MLLVEEKRAEQSRSGLVWRAVWMGGHQNSSCAQNTHHHARRKGLLIRYWEGALIRVLICPPVLYVVPRTNLTWISLLACSDGIATAAMTAILPACLPTNKPLLQLGQHVNSLLYCIMSI